MYAQPGEHGGAAGTAHGADDLLLELVPIADHLNDIVDLAAAQLQASCAVMLRSGGQLFTAATSDARAEAMSDWQFSNLTGPSLAAMDDNVATHFVAGTTPQWPAFERFAAEHQCISAMSMPLLVEGSTIGSFSAYRVEPQRFTVPEQQVAQQLVGQAAGVIDYLHRIAIGTDLTAAVAGRSAIDTALGILMARKGYGSEQAMFALRTDAAARGIQVAQAAVELVSGASGG
jgi:transcriptional regulator with GAF, ATPase, and Fis domain